MGLGKLCCFIWVHHLSQGYHVDEWAILLLGEAVPEKGILREGGCRGIHPLYTFTLL